MKHKKIIIGILKTSFFLCIYLLSSCSPPSSSNETNSNSNSSSNGTITFDSSIQSPQTVEPPDETNSDVNSSGVRSEKSGAKYAGSAIALLYPGSYNFEYDAGKEYLKEAVDVATINLNTLSAKVSLPQDQTLKFVVMLFEDIRNANNFSSGKPFQIGETSSFSIVQGAFKVLGSRFGIHYNTPSVLGGVKYEISRKELTQGSSSFAVIRMKLRTTPTKNVTMNFSSSRGLVKFDAGAGKVRSASLVFTPDNWNLYQEIQVYASPSALTGNTETTNEIVSFFGTSSDEIYQESVQTKIDEIFTLYSPGTPGFFLTSENSLTSEKDPDQEAKFKIHLTSRPESSVRFNVSGDDTEGDISIFGDSISPENWQTPISVTVTGKEDSVVDGNVIYPITVSVAESSDSVYANLSDKKIWIRNRDKEIPEVSISLNNEIYQNGDVLTLWEGNREANRESLGIKLASKPEENISLRIKNETPSGLFHFKDNSSSVVIQFTPDNYDDFQDIEYALDSNPNKTDFLGKLIIEPILEQSGAYKAMKPVVLNVIGKDNSGRALELYYPAEGCGGNPTRPSKTTTNNTVCETYSKDFKMQARLNSLPASSTPIEVSYGLEGVSTTTVERYQTDWNSWIQGPENDNFIRPISSLDDNNYGIVSLSFSVNAAISTGYPDSTISIPISFSSPGPPRTPPGLSGPASVLSEFSDYTFWENSGEVPIRVRLNSNPGKQITLDVELFSTEGPNNLSFGSSGLVTSTSLLFNENTWQEYQNIILIPSVNTSTQDSTFYIRLTRSDDTSNPYNFPYITVKDVNSRNGIDITTDTGASVSCNSSAICNLEEYGEFRAIGIALQSPPPSDGSTTINVVIPSENRNDLQVIPSSLTFGQKNWDRYQTVYFKPLGDGSSDTGPKTVKVQFQKNGNTVTEYSVNIQNKDILNEDREDSVDAAINFSESKLEVWESEHSKTFQVFLASNPRGNALFKVTSSDSSSLIVAPNYLIFDDFNYATPQTVTLYPLNNDQTGDVSSKVTITPDSNFGIYAESSLQKDLEVSVLDDEELSAKVENEANLPSPIMIGEPNSGEPAYYDLPIVLNKKPLESETISVKLSVSDPGEASVSPSELTFDSSAPWNVPQVVRVSSQSDRWGDGDQAFDLQIETWRGGESQSASVAFVNADGQYPFTRRGSDLVSVKVQSANKTEIQKVNLELFNKNGKLIANLSRNYSPGLQILAGSDTDIILIECATGDSPVAKSTISVYDSAGKKILLSKTGSGESSTYFLDETNLTCGNNYIYKLN